MKRTIALLLSLALILTLAAPKAAAALTGAELSQTDYAPSEMNRLYIYVSINGANAACTVEITAPNGGAAATLEKSGLSTNRYTLIWDGRAAPGNSAGLTAGDFVPEGGYTVNITCGDSRESLPLYVTAPETATKYGCDESGVPNYTGDPGVDYMAGEVLKEIPTEGLTNYEKLKAVYTWVQTNCYRANDTYVIHPDDADNTLYFDTEALSAEIAEAGRQYDALHAAGQISYDAYDNLYIRNARKMLIYRIGTCLEFSALFQVLLARLGFESWLADGYFINGDGSYVVHKWNLIRLNGVYYWSDIRIDNAEYERSGRTKAYYYYFLDPDTENWEKRHSWDHELYPYRDTLTPTAPEAEPVTPSAPSPEPVTPPSPAPSPSPEPITPETTVPEGRRPATATAAKLTIDGKSWDFEAYTIDDYNYFRLRDLALALTGTESRFNVGWDAERSAISLESGLDYTAVGGELSKSGLKAATAQPTPSTVSFNGYFISLTSYLINENNYFKLRDLGSLFGFAIGWDEASGTISITTGGAQ